MRGAHRFTLSKSNLELLAIFKKTKAKQREFRRFDLPTGVVLSGFCMVQLKQIHIRKLVLSYREFREATGLSKKEADSWVKDGLIRADLASNRRRRLYRLDSVIEGIIAKQLADFSSRKLLPTMMAAFHEYLEEQKIDLEKLEPNPRAPKILIMLYTRMSKEIMPGGGLRGVVAYVDRFDPTSTFIGKNVYLVVDLIGVVVEAWTNIVRLRV